jgi:hypothetical protein
MSAVHAGGRPALGSLRTLSALIVFMCVVAFGTTAGLGSRAQAASVPSATVLVPSPGAAALKGTTYLDAGASNATAVKFLLFGGTYGFTAPVVCSATATLYGWLCSWDTTTVPDGAYVLVAESFNASTQTFSPGVAINVSNNLSTGVVLPANGSFMEGTVWLDATASNATAVQFALAGGQYGATGQVVCTATATIYGWLCALNTSTIPIGTYSLTSIASNGVTSSDSAAVTVNAANGLAINPSHFVAVGCATATTCITVGTTPYSGGSPPTFPPGGVIERSTDGGATFSADTVPPNTPPLSGVTCPTTTLCIAVGGTDALISTDSGHTWTLVNTPATTGLSGVACETSLDCTAVGAIAGHSTWIYSTNAGQSWTTSPGPGGYGTGVTCLATSCIAVGDSMYRSTDGGAHWNLDFVGGPGLGQLFGVSCHLTGTTCAAVGPNPAGLSNSSSKADLAVSTDSAASFSNDSAQLPTSTATLEQVSCGGATTCVAIGPPNPGQSTLTGASTTTAGTTWTSFTGPSGQSFLGLSAPLLGIACTTASTCVLVAGNGAGPTAFVTTDAGQHWTASKVQ